MFNMFKKMLNMFKKMFNVSKEATQSIYSSTYTQVPESSIQIYHV